MKKYLLTAAAAVAIATPAQARDDQLYFGIEGDILFPKDNDADIDVNVLTIEDVLSDITIRDVLQNFLNANDIDVTLENFLNDNAIAVSVLSGGVVLFQ